MFHFLKKFNPHLAAAILSGWITPSFAQSVVVAPYGSEIPRLALDNSDPAQWVLAFPCAAAPCILEFARLSEIQALQNNIRMVEQQLVAGLEKISQETLAQQAIEQIRLGYDARIADLERRLAEIEKRTGGQSTTPMPAKTPSK